MDENTNEDEEEMLDEEEIKRRNENILQELHEKIEEEERLKQQ
jgi:hypothetical protein